MASKVTESGSPQPRGKPLHSRLSTSAEARLTQVDLNVPSKPPEAGAQNGHIHTPFTAQRHHCPKLKHSATASSHPARNKLMQVRTGHQTIFVFFPISHPCPPRLSPFHLGNLAQRPRAPSRPSLNLAYIIGFLASTDGPTIDGSISPVGSPIAGRQPALPQGLQQGFLGGF